VGLGGRLLNVLRIQSAVDGATYNRKVCISSLEEICNHVCAEPLQRSAGSYGVWYHLST